MSVFDGELQIRKIRSKGAIGGVIFSAMTLDGHKKRFVVKADWRLVRSTRLFKEKHVWHVKGAVTEDSITWKDGTMNAERVIKAESLFFVKARNENLKRLLSESDDFKGISVVKAEKLIDFYGDELINIALQGDVQRLLPVVGHEIAERLISGLRDYEELSALQLLDQLGVAPHIGDSVIKIWGCDSYTKIKNDPYLLTAFMADINLVDAYAIDRLDMSTDSPERLIAYAKHVLFNAFESGNTCLPIADLEYRLKRTLPTPLSAKHAIAIAVERGEIVLFDQFAQVRSMAIVESSVAEIIHTRQSINHGESLGEKVEYALAQYEKANGITLTPEQANAVFQCCQNSMTLLTGGAGCGKTTVIKAISFVLEKLCQTSQVILMALAGKAAKRITEATGREAMTIASFMYHMEEDEIADDAVIIVDEASMVDILSLLKILKRFPKNGRIILTGDEEQLSPVGVGLGLHILVNTTLPCPRLTAVKRQSAESGIPSVAMGVRHYPILKMSIPFAEYKGKGFGVSFIECSEMELTQKTIDIYSDIGGDGTNNNVLMLSPVKHQYGGVDALNAKIHDSFVNGGALVLEQTDGSSITHHMLGRSLRVGDLVMYTKNDYTRDIRNGSVGKIIQQNQDVITVDFEGNIVDLSWSDLSNLEYAYALTVHKSQGSQYDRVVVVIKKSRNLDRHLIYTAITRAKHQVVFVGDFSQFELALTKSNALSRHTLLAQHIEHRKNTK